MPASEASLPVLDALKKEYTALADRGIVIQPYIGGANLNE